MQTEREPSGNGIVTIPCRHPVEEAVQRLEQLLSTKGVKIFAKVDHSGEAESAGLQMRNTKLLIFGSPKGGTALMVAAPTIAIDLPLKILIWEDTESKVWVSYNNPEFLRARHDLAPSLVGVLAGVSGIAEAIAQ